MVQRGPLAQHQAVGSGSWLACPAWLPGHPSWGRLFLPRGQPSPGLPSGASLAGVCRPGGVTPALSLGCSAGAGRGSRTCDTWSSWKLRGARANASTCRGHAGSAQDVQLVVRTAPPLGCPDQPRAGRCRVITWLLLVNLITKSGWVPLPPPPSPVSSPLLPVCVLDPDNDSPVGTEMDLAFWSHQPCGTAPLET